jgi:hypothetical protein
MDGFDGSFTGRSNAGRGNGDNGVWSGPVRGRFISSPLGKSKPSVALERTESDLFDLGMHVFRCWVRQGASQSPGRSCCKRHKGNWNSRVNAPAQGICAGKSRNAKRHKATKKKNLGSGIGSVSAGKRNNVTFGKAQFGGLTAQVAKSGSLMGVDENLTRLTTRNGKKAIIHSKGYLKLWSCCGFVMVKTRRLKRREAWLRKKVWPHVADSFKSKPRAFLRFLKMLTGSSIPEVMKKIGRKQLKRGEGIARRREMGLIRCRPCGRVQKETEFPYDLGNGFCFTPRSKWSRRVEHCRSCFVSGGQVFLDSP